MTPNLYCEENKSAFAWGQANLKCKGIWWDEKCTSFGGSFKAKVEIIWSNIALNRSFCHFRYFWEEIWKRKHFGRFWSEKVKKTTKSQNHAENNTGRRQGILVMASRLDREVDKSNTRDARESFPKESWRRHPLGSPRPSRIITKRDCPKNTKSDGIRSGSRQYEYYFGGELTASDPILDAVIL